MASTRVPRPSQFPTFRSRFLLPALGMALALGLPAVSPVEAQDLHGANVFECADPPRWLGAASRAEAVPRRAAGLNPRRVETTRKELS